MFLVCVLGLFGLSAFCSLFVGAAVAVFWFARGRVVGIVSRGYSLSNSSHAVRASRLVASKRFAGVFLLFCARRAPIFCARRRPVGPSFKTATAAAPVALIFFFPPALGR